MSYIPADRTQFFKRDSKIKNALALLLTILVSCLAKAQNVQSVLTVPSVGPELSNSMAGKFESLTTDLDELAGETFAVRVYAGTLDHTTPHFMPMRAFLGQQSGRSCVTGTNSSECTKDNRCKSRRLRSGQLSPSGRDRQTLFT